jgi:mutator protein MutT
MTAYTHAGGIVFQQRGEKVYYLIVRAKPDPSHWVIPKGHIEPGEVPETAAVREIREEAGIIARVLEPLGTLDFTYRGKEISTIIYLMEYLEETLPQEEREFHWGPYDEVSGLLTFEDTRTMLQSARKILLERGRTGE